MEEIKDQYIPTCFEYIPWYFEIMVPFSLKKKEKEKSTYLKSFIKCQQTKYRGQKLCVGSVLW